LGERLHGYSGEKSPPSNRTFLRRAISLEEFDERIRDFNDHEGFEGGASNAVNARARICRAHNELQNLLECVILFFYEKTEKREIVKNSKGREHRFSVLHSPLIPRDFRRTNL
jgi:hypothetical protein